MATPRTYFDYLLGRFCAFPGVIAQTIDSLVASVATLEDRYGTNWTEYFEATSGSSGTLTIPDGHEVVLNQWPDGFDGVVRGLVGGVPDGSVLIYDTNGNLVTTTLDAAGNWAYSGTPVGDPCIIFAARTVGGGAVAESEITFTEIW